MRECHNLSLANWQRQMGLLAPPPPPPPPPQGLGVSSIVLNIVGLDTIIA